MDTQPTCNPNDLLTHVVGDIANAISERAGESQRQQDDRREAAASTVMAFMPCDAVEAMLAGHCVMFHEMIVDSVLETLRGEDPASRRATRGNIVAMDKAFGNNLARLEAYRTSQTESAPEIQPEDDRAETEIADRVHRHQSTTEPRQQAPAAREVGTILHYPSTETNTAAPEAAEPQRFTDAGQPGDARQAADRGLAEETRPQAERTNGSGDSARYAGNRQARRHPNP
jgi:ATP-dependent exoDNAse (exonuclease V) beta subunit